MSDINLATLAQNLNIQTVEQLHVYTAMLLNRLHPNLKVRETQEADTIFAAQFNIYQIADGTQRIITRTSIEIDPTFTSDKSKKLWMFAQRLDGNVQLPVGFLSN